MPLKVFESVSASLLW